MSRLIDADRLLSERMKSMYYHLPNGDIAVPLIDIENAPTVEERKTGHWVEDGYHDGEIVCSECGEPCSGFIMTEPRDKFCKWCGAKMEVSNGRVV